MAPKKFSLRKVVPPEERYDFERMELMNPSDPRSLGPPCHGEHEVAPPGRGSVTGANRHAMWEGCLHCGIRMKYVPAFGAHAMSRKAGPLGNDVAKQMEEKKPAAGSMELQNQKISLDAAERSLKDRLTTIQKQKEDWVNMQKKKDNYAQRAKDLAGGYPKGPVGPDKTQSTLMPSQGGGSAEDYMMSQTPGRKSIRKAEMTSEEAELMTKQEFMEKKEEEEEWQKVNKD